MKINSLTAACLLVASGFVAAQAFAQGAPAKAAEAQRLQQLKAQREARIAAAKARENQIQRPTATPNPPPPPTTTPTAPPTIAVPTTRPTATTAPTTTPTAAATAAPTATATASTTASARASAAAAASAAPQASVAPPPPLPSGLDLEELKKSRPDRRKAEFGQLQARWGELLRDQRAASELKLHAQRVAYLQRIRALATKANDTKTVQAVDILITKEETRSADAMNALRSGALPTVAAGGTK